MPEPYCKFAAKMEVGHAKLGMINSQLFLKRLQIHVLVCILIDVHAKVERALLYM